MIQADFFFPKKKKTKKMKIFFEWQGKAKQGNKRIPYFAYLKFEFRADQRFTDT